MCESSLTDNIVDYGLPGILICKRDKQESHIKDKTVPANQHIIRKKEKMLIIEYGVMRIEIGRMYYLSEAKSNIISIVIGLLGSI